MEDRTNITSHPPMQMELQVQAQTQIQDTTVASNEEIYTNWWRAQFVDGRVGVTFIKVMDASPVLV
jgi:hypothetical protein